MQIIFYSPQSLPSIGGLQYVVHYWAEGLHKKGHAITLLTETAGDASADKNLPYRVLRNAGWWTQVQAMRKAGHVVMFNVSLKGLPAWIMACFLSILTGKGRIPLYLSHHTALWYDEGPRPMRQRLKRWVANNIAAKNCACSQYIASLYKNCDIIYSPYRKDVIVPGTENLKADSILFVGRLVSDKGVDLLLKACGLLQQQAISFHLTIVGDGPERQNLEQMAQRLELPVAWLGSYPAEVGGALVTSDAGVVLATSPSGDGARTAGDGAPIMVVPSRMEPMGMVVAEGLANGCRMVVSRQGGLPEVGGAFCHYFQSGDAEDLARSIKEAFLQPKQIDPVALKQHLSHFTIDYSVDRLEGWLGKS